MNWLNGFTGAYYATYIDPVTWRDASRFEITGGSVEKQGDDLRASASIDCVDYPSGSERWIRIYLEARQGGDVEKVALFTGLATSPEKSINGVQAKSAIECYSVLKPAEDILLARGWYVPAETVGTQAIKKLLSVTPAPVIVADGSPAIGDAIIAEDGETHLTMIDKVLAAINWRLKIDGDGTIRVEPQATKEVAVFDAIEHDVIEPQITITRDWYDVPNVFRAISDGVSAVAKDESVKSPYSIPNRGREVWAEEDDCELSGDETIAEYATRQLGELQKVGVEVKYTRRFMPEVQPSDLVMLRYPGQGLEGLYKIVSQSFDLGYGCKVGEEVTYNG